jgi:hypothetical protein
MDQDKFRTAAEQWINRFDGQAHQAVGELRNGGERLGRFARERWDRAFAESSPQLSEETRRNASHARDVFARWYGKGVDVSTEGAGRVVDAFVGVARTAVSRAADWRERRA